MDEQEFNDRFLTRTVKVPTIDRLRRPGFQKRYNMRIDQMSNRQLAMSTKPTSAFHDSYSDIEYGYKIRGPKSISLDDSIRFGNLRFQAGSAKDGRISNEKYCSIGRNPYKYDIDMFDHHNK
jgi:hypothetical protein